MEDIKTFEIEQVDVNLIKLDSTNPNEVPKEKMDALRKIMKEKGMLQPVLIDQENMMIDGEHRYIIFKEFGMKKIPCFRLEVNDTDRRLLRQTMNKLKGSHNPREDIEDLIRLTKEKSVRVLSEYLGMQEKNLQDYIDSKNQAPESYIQMVAEEKGKVKRTHFINFKLTDEQAKKLLEEMGEDSLKDIVLVPLSGLIVNNIGK